MKTKYSIATFALFIALMAISSTAEGQISAKLFRYMDVSATQLTFVYGGDIWIAPKTGGTAIQLTHSPGEESWPRFSPDGTTIAYTASYNGNLDVYTIPVQGGVPYRVTYHSFADRMIDWHPDGEHLLIANRSQMGQRSSRHLYQVSKMGGLPTRLEIPYAELASYSPDGNHLAYITKITENYPFKRYRGGLTSDILIYDKTTKKVKNITENEANDGKPAWGNNKLFFLSDQAADMRINLWSYDPSNEGFKQITEFKNFDISFLSAGANDLVFEMGGDLYLMDQTTEKYAPVKINIISDLSVEMTRSKKVSDRIRTASPSPKGNRVVFEARGELFDVPAKDGYTINLTHSSGAFDQYPSWSPNGKHIAYWSDKSGEYELYLQATEDEKKDQKLTNNNGGYGYDIFWSPDSKHITYIDEKNNIRLINVATKSNAMVDNMDWNVGHPGRQGFQISWSPDSKWITYTKGLGNANNAVFIYDTQAGTKHQVTSSFYENFDPIFSHDGKHLFFFSDRNLRPHYSDMGDGTWVYPNATQIASLALMPDTESIFAAKNDAVEIEEEKKDDGEEDDKEGADSKGKKNKGDNKDGNKMASEDAKDKDADGDAKEAVKIDFADMESRVELLPMDAGNMGNLISVEGKLIFMRYPNTGSESRDSKLMMYSFEDEEEEVIMEGVGGASLTADGKKLFVGSRGKYGFIKPGPKQKIKDPVPTDGLVMNWVPKEEWHQIFNDAWRRHRDFFYDPNMHGVDWDQLKKQYGALIDDARTRWDVNNIVGNLAAELSAGHTYTSGGDQERAPRENTGYLGIDWEKGNTTSYRIKRIVRPAAWDTEVRSPFDKVGSKIKTGHYVHAVNGIPIEINKDPYAAFNGLAGKTVGLLVSETGNAADAETYPVELLREFEEGRLRYLEWLEDNRKMVDKLSNGKLGYVYMSNTGGQGQLELVRMYYGQLDREGFVIDERFNGGGQLADRFLELLTKPVVYNLHWRHGRDHTHPIKTNTGPKGMLINGWAGSGGDGLPWAFQELEAGPIVGERTLGILVGPATGHGLIDGGRITVPGARLYDNDGHWFWEGEGVRPDIKVWDDPNILMQGRDPQMERVVEEIMKLLPTEGTPRFTPAPKPDDRTAKGLGKS